MNKPGNNPRTSKTSICLYATACGHVFFKKGEDVRLVMSMAVGGLGEVISWVVGFARQAEVVEPAYLRQAVSQEVADTAERYAENSADMRPWPSPG